VGVSSIPGVIDFDVASDPEIFSGILFRNRTFEKSQIEILGLAEEVSRYGLSNKKLVIKMDIEGAEFKILNNLETLKLSRNLMHSYFLRFIQDLIDNTRNQSSTVK